MQFYDAAATKDLLDYRKLKLALEAVIAEYARGEVESPERLVVPCGEGSGVLLSMPCHARDIVVHKLLTIYASNPSRGLPAIQGHVTAFDATTGVPLFCLDGPATTSRRTAAITMIGIERLSPTAPASVCVIGTGAQARAHVEAIREMHPCAKVGIRGTSAAAEKDFCLQFGADGHVAPQGSGEVKADVVVAVTNSRKPVYDQKAVSGQLVVGTGAYRLDMVEIGPRTIRGSQVYVDDPVGAPGEAGDVVAAKTDWSKVRSLSEALATPPDFSRPAFLKSVGCGAWDLAACRVARLALGT